MSNWCFEEGEPEGAVVKVVRDGKTYIDIKNYDRLRELFGELLREVQRIKSKVITTPPRRLWRVTV